MNKASPTVAIIGAGPAGLAAAEILSANGCTVTVYDRKPTPARKFLMAGRGGLNLTHSENIDSFLARYGAARSFMEPFIRAFTPDDLKNWCEALGQETFVGSSGRIFPKTMKASPLLRAWLARLTSQGATIETGRTWTGWDLSGALNFAGIKKPVTADATLLALGGASWPDLGSDGSWTSALKANNVPLVPFTPSNCGFVVPWSDYIKQRFAGQPLKNVRLFHQGRSLVGEIVIGVNGVEGGAIYALSAFLRDTIAKEGKTSLFLDLHPHQDDTAIFNALSQPRGRQSFPSFLRRALNLGPLQTALLYEADQHIGTKTAEDIAALIKACPLTLTAPFPIERAISSAGGIAREAVDSNLMLKNIPGTFVAGEMLDWEAPTGGYLLQGCFATGRAAAKGILSYLGR